GKYSTIAQRHGESAEIEKNERGSGEMKVTVVGSGAWGAALAKLLSEAKQSVTFWGHRPEHLEQIRRTGRNEPYLPGIDLPHNWNFETDLKRAVEGAEYIVVAVPSKTLREVTRNLADYSGILVSVTKGIEDDTGLTMSGVLRANAPRSRITALTGPTLALEVARGVPTAAV